MGQRVRRALDARNRSQDWLARQAMCNPATIGRVIKGKTQPTDGNTHLIAQALQVPVSWLRDGPPGSPVPAKVMVLDGRDARVSATRTDDPGPEPGALAVLADAEWCRSLAITDEERHGTRQQRHDTRSPVPAAPSTVQRVGTVPPGGW